MKSKLTLAALVFVAAGTALTGCAGLTSQAAINASPETVPGSGKLPVRVGVLVSQTTRDFTVDAHIPLGQWAYPFGKDVERVAQQTFSQVFEEVSIASSPDYKSYDLIVEPQFDAAATHVDLSMSSAHVVVAMTFDVTSAAGSVWRKSFTGEMTTGGTYPDMATHGQAMSKAVAAAAAAMRDQLGAAAQPKPAASASAGGPAPWWAK